MGNSDIYEMAPGKAEAVEKERYFNRLAALKDISDEEEDSNDVRGFLRKSKKVPPVVGESAPERARKQAAFKKVPVIHRTISAPPSTASPHEEMPHIPKKSTLRRSESATPLAPDSSTEKDAPIAFDPRLSSERRKVPDPTIGSASLILNYSTGIKSLLGRKRKATGTESVAGKKKKRKETKITLVPDNQQIFKGLTFFYIPPDDVPPDRKVQINKSMDFGASWTKDFIESTTHIVADKTLCPTRKDVLTFLKLEDLPERVILVNNRYPVDCITYRYLLDPSQQRYTPKTGRAEDTIYGEDGSQAASQILEASLQVKGMRSSFGNGNNNQSTQTPPRSQGSTQISRSKANLESVPKNVRDAATVETAPLMTFNANERKGGNSPTRPGDTLDDMISLARSMKDVPVDEDESGQEHERPSSRDESGDSGTEDEGRRPPSRGMQKKKGKITLGSSFNQANFSCMTGGTGITPASNPNGQTIEVLQKMCDFYGRTIYTESDRFRHNSYRKAISILRKQSSKITTYDEAFALPHIGKRLATKIEEIVLTNRLRKLDHAIMEPRDHTLQLFLNIYDVGMNRAWKWILQGHKTLEDLTARADLTKHQRLGIEHYDEFLQRIPRDEVTALGDIVKVHSAAIDSGVEVTIGGSYRRGAATSGDIDCLFSKAGTSSSRDLLPFLGKLVAKLDEIGFLVASVAEPTDRTDSSGSKWHGCCVLPGSENQIWRRIDFLLVPETEFGAALIYFTGDDIFNRSIRLLASQKGCRLNQRGLYKDVMRGPGRVKLNEGELVEGTDEKKIFSILGVPWRPPEQRICH